jgi:hypothetical protein
MNGLDLSLPAEPRATMATITPVTSPTATAKTGEEEKVDAEVAQLTHRRTPFSRPCVPVSSTPA